MPLDYKVIDLIAPLKEAIETIHIHKQSFCGQNFKIKIKFLLRNFQ